MASSTDAASAAARSATPPTARPSGRPDLDRRAEQPRRPARRAASSGQGAQVVRQARTLGPASIVVVGEKFQQLAQGSRSSQASPRPTRPLPRHRPAERAGDSVALDASWRQASHWARRPCRSRCASVASRCLRGVTTSRSSPWRRTVRARARARCPSRITSETEAPGGSRSSPTSTPCSLDAGLIVTCSRSAATRSSGAASTSRPRGSERRVDPQAPRHRRQRRAGEQGVDHDDHEHDVEEPLGAGRRPRRAGSWRARWARRRAARPRTRTPAHASGIGCTTAADQHRQGPRDQGQQQPAPRVPVPTVPR